MHTHTPIQRHTPLHAVCLQTSLRRNCSDIYICTWSLSASFHYLEPDLERGRLEWMADDWNERESKCTWKSYFESKPSFPSIWQGHSQSVCVAAETPNTPRTHKCPARHVNVYNMEARIHTAGRNWIYTYTGKHGECSCVSNHYTDCEIFQQMTNKHPALPPHNTIPQCRFHHLFLKAQICRRTVISLRPFYVTMINLSWLEILAPLHYPFVIKYLFGLFAGGRSSVMSAVTSV